MRETFLPLLEAHGVDLTFGGHSHTYERSILMHGHYGHSKTYDSEQHALNAGDGRSLQVTTLRSEGQTLDPYTLRKD